MINLDNIAGPESVALGVVPVAIGSGADGAALGSTILDRGAGRYRKDILDDADIGGDRDGQVPSGAGLDTVLKAEFTFA